MRGDAFWAWYVGVVLTWSVFLSVYLQYTVLIVMLFMMESVIGLLSYVYQEQVSSDLGDSLEDIFIQRYHKYTFTVLY